MWTIDRLVWAGLTAIALGSSGTAAATDFTFKFDETGDFSPGLPEAPFVGGGTFTFAKDPGVGEFVLSNLGTFSASFSIDGASFTASDIETPLSEVLVEIGGAHGSETLSFSSNNPTGFGSGPADGSLDFVNGGYYLSFAPPAVPNFLNLYIASHADPVTDDNPDFLGRYSASQIALAVPEPDTWLLMLGGAAFLGVPLRLQRHRRR